MDVDDDQMNQVRGAKVALQCDNCSSCFQNDFEVTALKVTSTSLDAEVQILDALAFIYGVSWTSVQNHKSEKITQFLRTQDDFRFCSNCTSLLNDNYNSHLRLEHSSDLSSIVKLFKDFRDYQINSPEKQTRAQFLSNDVVDQNIKLDLHEDFVSDDPDEDPFQLEDPVEHKYEPPSTSTEDVSGRNISSIGSEQIQSPTLSMSSLRSNRQLVIKSEKLSPEEILQYTIKPGAKKNIKRTTPRKPKKVKNGNGQREGARSRLKKVSPTKEKIIKVAQNFQTKRKKEEKKTETRFKPDSSFEEKVKLILEKYKDHDKSKCHKICLDGRFICSVCGKSFKDFPILKFNHWRHIHRENNTCVCEICGKSLKTRKYMKWHLLRAHATEEEQNKWKRKCHLCETAVFTFELSSHINSTHKNLPQEKCDQCGKVCANKASLRSHLEVHNKTSEKCDLCDKVFSSKKYLKNHKKIIHGNMERNFFCDICPLKFYTKWQVDHHRLTHNDLRQHVCEECGKTFKYVGHFRTHLQCHKEIAEKGGWAFSCDLCEGKKFKHSVGLRKHMLNFHPTNNRSRKIYECSVCAKQLSSATVLRDHENMHKKIPGFTPRVRNKVPEYIKAQIISSDKKLTVVKIK